VNVGVDAGRDKVGVNVGVNVPNLFPKYYPNLFPRYYWRGKRAASIRFDRSIQTEGARAF
jgi:hypothetical protein